MSKLQGLRKASHFGPTLIVTTIGWLFANYYWWEGPAYVIAFGIFCGQLVVGWSNDLYDYEDDLAHQRTKKPLVAGLITPEYLRKWIYFMTPFAFFANHPKYIQENYKRFLENKLRENFDLCGVPISLFFREK